MKLSIVHKLAFHSILTILLTAMVVSVLFYNKTTDILVHHLLDDISSEIDDAGKALQSIITNQTNDVLFLSNTPPVQGMLRALANNKQDVINTSSYNQWQNRLNVIFQSQLERKSSYLSIRYINKQGQEMIHVGRDGVNIIRFTGNKLQNKSERTYVKETFKLSPNEIYVSEINLNREFGKVVKPHQEVLRVATPIYDEADDKIAGLIVITAEIGNKLRDIQNRVKQKSRLHHQHSEDTEHIQISDARNIYITNDHGGYILHPDNTKTYGFDLGKRYRIQEDFIHLAKLFLPGNKQKQFTTLPDESGLPYILSFTKIPIDVSRPDRYIAVIMTQSYDNIVATETEVLNDLIALIIVLVLLGVGAAVLISLRFTRPLKNMTIAISDFAQEKPTLTSLPVQNQDEIGVLARAFDSMTAQIEESHSNLKQMNENLENLVDERTASLVESEEQQRTILETIADGIIIIDQNSLITSFNSAAENIFGYSEDEVLGNNVTMLMPEVYREKHKENTDNSSITAPKIININRDLIARKKSGEEFPVEINVSPFSYKNTNGFVAIIRDITERSRIERMKNEFISTVSHELRTPLTSIRGSLGLLQGNTFGELPEQANEMLSIASSNTERLLLLINDILDIQKIESGQMALKFENIMLMPFIEQAIRDNASYGDQFGIKFSIAQDLAGAKVYADKDRLMQVMANLLSNAAKFSPENDAVEISVARHEHNNTIRVSVTDHGAGIPEEFQEKIFDKFTQSDSSDTRKKGGTGLGLNISKAIVERHGGVIGFVTKENIGTTFYFDLPAIDKNKIRNSEPELVSKKHKSCILIIEDDQDIAALLRRMLAEHGYLCDVAYDAESARQLINKNKDNYKLITLDLMLPGESGISFIEQLRSSEDTRTIPVVVVSATADKTRRNINASAVGIVDWMQKPINQERLINTVKDFVGVDVLPRVLHVEDEEDVHFIVKSLLKDSCDITWAKTFTEAKEILNQEDFSLILLDIGLPDGSGLNLLDQISEKNIPPQVVIFSAYDVSEEYASKVNEVLVKSKTDHLHLAKVINDLIRKNIKQSVKG